MKTSWNLSAWAIENQPLVRFLMIMFLLGGFWGYTQLSQKEDPDFPFHVMVVGALWPGATASEVQLQVIERIEKRLQDVPHLDYIESTARPGQAAIYVRLKQGTTTADAEASWYQVRKKVGDLKHELPSDVLGPIFNDEFGDVFGMIYAITGDGYSFAELKTYADSIRQQLLAIPNVAKINIIGQQDQKIYIEFSHMKIATLGLDPQSMIDTIQDQNALESAGILRTGDNEIILRPSGNFDSLQSISNLNIHAAKGDFRLGDIATIYRGYEDPPTYKMRYQGKESLGLAISMNRSGNIVDLGNVLKDAIKNIQAELPVGVEIHQIVNQPVVVKSSIHLFVRSLFEAVMIIMVVSVLSLGFRAGSVVAMSIPLVMAITFLVMMFLNLDLQRISLGAMIIALGLLVDDAMITVEMMMRKLEEGLDKFKAVTFAYTATAFPMLTGTLITIAGFMPIGLAKSDAGTFTFSLFAVVAISLIASWFVAVIFAPYIGYHVLKAPIHHETHKPGRILVYVRSLVEKCVERRNLVITLTVAMFLLSIFGFGYVQRQFFPFSERPELVVSMTLPEGTPFVATERVVKRFESLIANNPDIEYYTSYVGGYTPRFYLALSILENSSNFGQVVVLTKGGEARERAVAAFRTLLAEHFPNVQSQVSYLQNGPPVVYPLQFRVSGKNPNTVYKIAAEVEDVMRKNPYAINTHINWQKRVDTLLTIDSDKSRQMGISGQKLAENLQAVLSGLEITKFREKNELIGVDIRGLPQERANLSTLKDINVYTRSQRFVPLDQIVQITPGVEEGVIRMKNGLPSIVVSADVGGSVQALDVAHAIDKELIAVKTHLPPGYKIDTEGVAESSSTAVHSIFVVLPVAIAVMALLLMLQLHSFQRVILVFITAPLGLIGITITLLLFNLPFGFVAMLGVISLSGMIMRNTVILIDQIEVHIADGMEARTAIIQATIERFRPIVLTAGTAILAMIPLLESLFWAPMAAAIMGGLIAGTALTILFFPALYASWKRV